MSISEHAPGTCPGAGPAQVLADALAAVRGLAEGWWSARSDGELVDTVALVQQVSSALAEADVRDLARTRLSFGSTGDWVTHVGGLRRGEGKQRVARA